MSEQEPVLVATTMDAGSDHALLEAAAIARSMKVSLHICHILPELYGHHPLFPQLRELEREHFEQIRMMVESAIREQLKRVLGEGHDVEVHIEAGSPHTEILRLADRVEPCLIVVGAASDKVGGIAERVVRSAPCPVLVALRHSGKAILAATDFSDPALPAVQAAVKEAHRRRKPCYVLHSVDVTTIQAMPAIDWSGVAVRMLDALRAEARKRLEEVGARFGKNVKTVLSEGPPSEAILGKADELDADLIVLGTHGHRGLRRLALGSVAETVVRRSDRSILVVRLAQ